MEHLVKPMHPVICCLNWRGPHLTTRGTGPTSAHSGSRGSVREEMNALTGTDTDTVKRLS